MLRPIALIYFAALITLSAPALAQEDMEKWLSDLINDPRVIEQMKTLREAPWASPSAAARAAFSGTEEQKPAVRPLLVFASFSMPEASLKALLEQTGRAGGTVVLRGLVNNNFSDTKLAVARIAKEGGAGLSVNPKLYRLFGVESVPTFVIMKESLAPCVSVDCHERRSRHFPDHDRIAGNMTVVAALRALERDGDYPELARRYIAKIGGGSK